MNKILMLGTALWGLGIDKRTCFLILDKFVESGGQWVDTATNYPIDKKPENYGFANRIIREWLHYNPNSGIKVFCKIGSANNAGGSDNILNGPATSLNILLARSCFGESLGGVAVHWDDRYDATEVSETLDQLRGAQEAGLEIGFSGVQNPKLYADGAPDMVGNWWIQVKHNAATSDAYYRYINHFPDERYIAYGINMGGVKSSRNDVMIDSSLAIRGLTEPRIVSSLRSFLSSPSKLSFPLKDLSDLTLLMAVADNRLSGLIIGPRTVEQLDQTMALWNLAKQTALSKDDVTTLIKLFEGSPYE